MLRITISGRTILELQEQIADLYTSVAVVEKTLGVKDTQTQFEPEALIPPCEATTPSEVVEEKLPPSTLTKASQTVEIDTTLPVGITKEEVNAALGRVMKNRGLPAALEILERVGGVKKVSELLQHEYALVIEACEK